MIEALSANEIREGTLGMTLSTFSFYSIIVWVIVAGNAVVEGDICEFLELLAVSCSDLVTFFAIYFNMSPCERVIGFIVVEFGSGAK
ncbi:MAG: hypothetical protein DWQ02_21780 [Bacteroidetes bacterium]|nr:MAG: hypothetical protein DWQ02_21780 [Bacteroidota bacterium]